MTHVEDERVRADSRVVARLLGSSLIDPAVMGAIIDAGFVAEDVAMPGLRFAFEALRDEYTRNGTCTATLLLSALSFQIEPEDAREIVDWLREPENRVEQIDDVAGVVDAARQSVALRSLFDLAGRMRRAKDPKEAIADVKREIVRIESGLDDGADDDVEGSDKIFAFGLGLLDGSVKIRRIELGFPEIDRSFSGGPRLGTTVAWISQSGSGKTTAGIVSCLHVAAMGMKSLYLAAEDAESVRLQINEMTAGMVLDPPPPPGSERDSAARLALGKAQDEGRFFFKPARRPTPWALAKTIMRYKRRHPDLVRVVVDYLTALVVPGVKHIGDATEIATDVLVDCFAALGISGVILSQLGAEGETRLRDKPGSRIYGEDAAGGKYLNRTAAYTITSRRDRLNKDEKKRNTSHLEVVKDRDARSGRFVECHRRFNPTTRQWRPCAPDGEDIVEVANAPTPDEPSDLYHPDEPSADAVVDELFGRRADEATRAATRAAVRGAE